MALPRLRQVVLAAADLAGTADALEQATGVADPFRDEGVGHFGLQNAVYNLGDTFIEIVSPVEPDTAAGRYLSRRGGDCGYMVMFEVADEAAARRRVSELGIRLVHDMSYDDIVDLHLHPKDVPPAIVALDVTNPVGSWRWGGPRWVGAIPAYGAGGVRGATIASTDPASTAARWAAVLGVTAAEDATIALDGGAQQLRFVDAPDETSAGLVGVDVECSTTAGAVDVGGVRFQRTTKGQP